MRVAAAAAAAAAAVTNTSYMLRMRDGAALHTLLFLPSPLPPATRLGCVVIRTPYGIDDAGSAGALAAGYAAAGWAAIAQDERGRYGSAATSEYAFFRTEANDTADTLAWAAAQPWSNGLFAQTGTSANAISGYVVPLADPVAPAGMAAQFNIVGTSTAHEVGFQGGAFREGLFAGWLTEIGEPDYVPVVEAHEGWSDYWLSTTATGSDASGGAPRWQLTDFPTLHAAGWYDIFSSAQIAVFDALQANGGPRNAGSNWLVVEPGGHCAGGAITWPNASWGWGVAQTFSIDLFATAIGKPLEVLQPERARAALLRAMRREVASHVKRGASRAAAAAAEAEAEAQAQAQAAAPGGRGLFRIGEQQAPIIIWYVLGPGTTNSVGNFWASAPGEWPSTTPTPYFLQAGGVLSPSPPPSGPAPPPPTSWVADPSRPVPTLGGNNLIISPCGPQDQRPVEAAHADSMALFTTAAFTDVAFINGMMTAQIWVTSTAPDTDVTAKLTDIFPSGESMLIQDGILRLRWREGPLATQPAAPLTPGEAVQVTVEIGFMSYAVNAGHRLRLALASSNAKRFSVNRNNGRPLTDNTTAPVVATNAVLHDAEHPSALVLPLLDPARLAELRV